MCAKQTYDQDFVILQNYINVSLYNDDKFSQELIDYYNVRKCITMGSNVMLFCVG